MSLPLPPPLAIWLFIAHGVCFCIHIPLLHTPYNYKQKGLIVIITKHIKVSKERYLVSERSKFLYTKE